MRLQANVSECRPTPEKAKKRRKAQWRARGGPDIVIETNLGAPRAVLARGVFDFAFAGNLNRVNLHQTFLPFFVEPETAPYPLPSILHQSAFDWIFMHVLQLLSQLVPAVYVEIVEPWLPETRQPRISRHESQA